MRLSPRTCAFLAGVLAVSAAALPGATARAESTTSSSASAGAGGDIVARVGSRVITAGDLERRIASVPLFQLRGFGKSPEEIRRNFLERVMIREQLLSQGAEDRKLAERADVQDRVRSVLRGMLLSQVRSETQIGKPISETEVRAYYDENRAKYNAPPRVAIWRIVLGSRDEAARVIEDLKKDLSPKRWTDITREKSLDKTNNMRSGNLGFVNPDGTTSEPEVKIAPEILAAVAGVKDGELVPEPVKDGDRFDVLWRRQSMRAVARTLEQEELSIRQIISHTKIEDALKTLIEDLRRDYLKESSPELVDQVDISASGELQQQRRPGTLPSANKRAVARPIPTLGGGGMR